MSKIKVQQPVIHTPSFKRWMVNRPALVYKLEELRIKPFPEGVVLDQWYYYSNLEGWSKVLYDLVFNSSLYKPDIFDCEIPQGLAWVLGFFYAEGFCDLGRTTGLQRWGGHWEIANKNCQLLEKCIEPLKNQWVDMDFKIHLVEQGQLYFLNAYKKPEAPFGTRQRFIEAFRQLFYTDLKFKKVPGVILEGSDDAKQAFLNAVIEGDGYKKGRYITTKGQPGALGLYMLMRDLYLCPVMRRRGNNLFNINYHHWNADRDKAIMRLLKTQSAPIPISRLAKETGVNTGTMTWIINRLERHQFVRSSHPQLSRRNIELVLMPHCQDYALKAQTVCAERYELNSLRLCIGDIPQGKHGFNLFPYGDGEGIEGIMLFEPNEGYKWSGILEMGEKGYQPELVLI